MTIERIASRARNSIGWFCMQECHAYCCRKGKLPLNEKQMKDFSKTMGKEEAEKRIHKTESGYHYALEGGCIFLQENFSCKIHKSKRKPKTCSNFPIYIKQNNVFIASKCSAVQEGLLYPYIRKMKLAGANIVETEDEYKKYTQQGNEDMHQLNMKIN